jgi:excisionase family DNA binding protein
MTGLDLLAPILTAVDERVDKLVNERLEELNQSPWMNVKEAADYLRCGTSRLYKLTAADAIPHFKEEGRLLFNRHELDSWLENFRRGPDAETAAAGGDPTAVAELVDEILHRGAWNRAT